MIPLMIASGAARDELGERVFADEIMGATVSAIWFGSASADPAQHLKHE